LGSGIRRSGDCGRHAALRRRRASANDVTIGIGTQDTTTTPSPRRRHSRAQALEKYLPKDGKYANISFSSSGTILRPAAGHQRHDGQQAQFGAMGDYPLS